MQLVAYGAQDIYLTGNPQITFFKVVYRRHTNFATESIRQTLNGTVDYGNTVSCTVSRNGDLITKVYLQTDVQISGADYGTLMVNPTTHFGNALLKNVEVEIGGQRIDYHTSQWMQIYTELTHQNKTSQNHPTGQRAGTPGTKPQSETLQIVT